MTAPGADRDTQEALSAVQRLVERHKLLSPEQGLQAARLITNDPSFEWPPPPPPRAPTPPSPMPSPGPSPAPAAPSAEPTEGSSPDAPSQ